MRKRDMSFVLLTPSGREAWEWNRHEERLTLKLPLTVLSIKLTLKISIEPSAGPPQHLAEENEKDTELC